MTKVLIVAPTMPDLPSVADEVAGLSNRVPSILLQGTVTRERIISAIEKEGRFEGFWFATHGIADGVMLSDGAMLSAYSISSMLNTADCEWVVFNTCGSHGLVSAIQLRSRVDVVATEADSIADTGAWEFGRLLAVEFSQTGNMRQAVSRVAPGSDVHRFYPSERRMMRQYANLSPTSTVQTDQTLEDKIDVIMGWVNGDERRGVKGLREQSGKILERLERIDQQMETAQAERDSLAAKLSTVQIFLIILGAGVIAAIVAIVWLFASGAV